MVHDKFQVGNTLNLTYLSVESDTRSPTNRVVRILCLQHIVSPEAVSTQNKVSSPLNSFRITTPVPSESGVITKSFGRTETSTRVPVLSLLMTLSGSSPNEVRTELPDITPGMKLHMPPIEATSFVVGQKYI